MNGDTENFIAASTPGGIEAQEKRGQMEQATKTTLPIDGTSGEKRAAWEKLGFIFHENEDRLFVNVLFPVGWKKQPTDHSMWSDLLDDKGRKRAAIFYKAAFYDRSAHIHFCHRFSVGCYSDDNTVTIKDCGTVAHVIGEHPKGDYKAMDELREKAAAWLNEKYPLWNDAQAYWD